MLIADETAIMLSSADLDWTFQVVAEGRTVLMAAAGRGHWIRLGA
jgi:hypothetical protein